MLKNIGIIGNGFVGKAVKESFKNHFEIFVYDVDKRKSNVKSLSELVSNCKVIFLCLPTPMYEDGTCNTSIVEIMLSQINGYGPNKSYDIVIKSTIPPGTTEEWNERFEKLNIVFNPEFLTERSAKFDFINQSRFILGGRKRNTARVADLYRWRFGDSVPCIETNFETAEMIKYMNNCFFATKVSFMNEMKLIADKSNVDWDLAVDGFVRDGRIGHSHLAVPGPDGKRGFGGSCFPKDIQAMINFGKNLDVDMNTLLGAWATNLQVRPEKDWENLKGRAVT